MSEDIERDDDGDYDVFEDSGDLEPIGSCDSCYCDLYEDDDYGGLCGHCEWWRTKAKRL